MIALLAFALPFALYTVLPSRMWNFDGVACAMALELGNPVYYFHGNHLLYGFLGAAFWLLLFPLHLRALAALQLFTSLLSAFGFLALYHLLNQQFKNRALALILVLTMAASAITWVWSVEAQVYSFGFLALAIATAVLLQPGLRLRWCWVGLAHGLAILAHVVHALWGIPALYWLWHTEKTPQGRKTALTEYSLCLSVCTLLPYLSVLIGVIGPAHPNRRWMERWLMGSAGLTSRFQWHTAGWTSPLQWMHTSLSFFWGSFWPYHTLVSTGGWIATGLSAVSLSILFAGSWRDRRTLLWRFSLLWLTVYGLFFMTWEPSMECYRFTDAIPLALLLGLGARRLHVPALRWGVCATALATLLFVNFETRIEPMSRLSNNGLYQELDILSHLTPENSIYLTLGGLPWIYMLYFNGRAAWDLHSFNNRDRFQSELLRHSSFTSLFIQEGALTDPSWQTALAHFKTQPVDHLPWRHLQ